MYIGRKRSGQTAANSTIYSPIDTSITVGTFQVGTRTHVKQAISEAKEAFPSGAEKAGKNESKS